MGKVNPYFSRRSLRPKELDPKIIKIYSDNLCGRIETINLDDSFDSVSNLYDLIDKIIEDIAEKSNYQVSWILINPKLSKYFKFKFKSKKPEDTETIPEVNYLGLYENLINVYESEVLHTEFLDTETHMVLPVFLGCLWQANWHKPLAHKTMAVIRVHFPK